MSLITNKPILAIETSMGLCSVSISSDGHVSSLSSEKNGMQSEMLFPMIQDLLNSHKIRMSDLSAVACTLGPGSFTGIRAAIASARGIKSVFNNIKLVGISTLELLAHQAKSLRKFSRATVLIESRKNEFYMQTFTSDLKPEDEIQILSIEEIQKNNDPNSIIISTSSISINELTMLPNSCGLISRSMEILEHKNTTINQTLIPMYIKEPNITLSKR